MKNKKLISFNEERSTSEVLLDQIIKMINSEADKSIVIFDHYVNGLNEDNTHKLSYYHISLKKKPDLINLYKELYKLKLELDLLINLLFRYENFENFNLDLSKNIAGLIYEKEFM